MAIRNPEFETFYLFALKPDPASDPSENKMIVSDVMAITNRIPCSSDTFFGSVGWHEGLKQHTDFLDSAGAIDYLYLHNHPSGDPSPSTDDVKITRALSLQLKDLGYNFRGHLVINHKTFARIDEDGGIQRGTISDEKMRGSPVENDPYAWPRHSSTIGVELTDSESIATFSKKLETLRSDPTQILGIFLNSRLQTVAITLGTEEQFRSLTQQQFRDYARTQGGSRLVLHAKKKTRDQAFNLIRKLGATNYFSYVGDFIVEVSGADGHPEYVSPLDNKLYEKTPEFFGGDSSQEKSKLVQHSVHPNLVP
ncbi:MAG: hypothetical protein EOP84_02310 [Verrucomicrobiaceae bacterium]|nr:MAG: hypothetical protein EOP84_02310 [Verrucomicrobiaceae bacterium]